MAGINSALTSFFNLIHNFVSLGVKNLSLAYFLDIFIFTAIIKLILLPLTISQTKSQVKMTEMQPKLKELQEKYKGDPQKLQQKQMELYKEMGASPFSGCLLIFIQFPIFIAMYNVIYKYTGFNDVGFLWIKSLGQKDALYILPLLSGLTTYIQGIMMTPKGDDAQAKSQKQMNIFMTLFITWVSINFKAALVLYWIISNLIQIAIQYFIINRIKNKEQEALAIKK
ncbi:membrane protein insertase YidC [Caloramator proteoclasticus]|uniref:YidC/Oxa1 family membrane protein insertase n=1 Tax=Caloramator proteoclasticus DSM 10124 TaxID=1121262 RepID=A0A1M4ZUM7_9CLOT|nr:membrane protein insertase YidC [Caloramator proteoclasticus]SHF21718.1 YidC/Oxa1 family membrane protein insertase [Caloramator proteoclasticus DSM 10124]